MNNQERVVVAVAVAMFPIFVSAQSQSVPRSMAASPDVYKVLAEDDKYRVIEATWKPGHRDNWHSHGSPVARYSLTDCQLKLHTPDGKVVEASNKAGSARIGPQAPSHSLENVGKADCKLILFEPK
jgi:hypothetical protein